MSELAAQVLWSPGAYSPAGDREPGDRAAWPGPLEAERLPADLIECDICHQVRDCVTITRTGCNLYVCSDCLPEHVEELEAML